MAKDIKQIDGYVPIEIIETALNEGIIEAKSEQMMIYFEKIAGHRIYTPKPIDNQFKEREEAALKQREADLQKKKLTTGPDSNMASTISNPIGTAAKMPAFMDKSLKIAEIYKVATDESTKVRDASDVLQKKQYGMSLATRYKEWMTPELFDYLSMKGPRAEAELRAACYPARVAFSHRVQKIEGQYWATPYITIFTPFNAMDANDEFDLKNGNVSYSFYLTKDREIHVVEDEIERVDTIKSPETKEKQKAESLKAWKNSNCEKRVRIVNPKTGVEQYALLLTRGTEGWQEKYFFKKPNAYQWPEVYNMTSCVHDGKVDYDEYWSRGSDKVTIEAMGREAIAKIPSIAMDTENLQCFRPLYIDTYDKKGRCSEIKAPKGWEEYMDKGANNFSRYWSQEFMERAVGYDDMHWGKD